MTSVTHATTHSIPTYVFVHVVCTVKEVQKYSIYFSHTIEMGSIPI